jgi:cytochrome c-type biogenesis protein CcmH/NrfG
MKTRIGVVVIALAMVFYLVLLGRQGVLLISAGTPVSIAFGLAVLLLPIIGAWVLFSTLRAGFQHQHLARRIAEEGLELDTTDLPRRPSGRFERPAADALFESVRAEVEADPENWRGYYRMARAYDTAGDRRRARETMKRAVQLEAAERAGAST